MGLGDFKSGGDSDDDENNKKSSSSRSSSDKQYHRVTKEEFEEFLDSLWYDWHEANPKDDNFRKFAKEKVYSIPPLNINLDDRITILVFSTIDERTGRARDKGQDAIRCVIWDTKLQRPIGGRRKTLRIQTWKSNLKPKIEDLVEQTSEYIQECPSCNTGWLVKREGQYGEFLGCVRYPDCNYTRNISDD